MTQGDADWPSSEYSTRIALWGGGAGRLDVGPNAGGGWITD
jgi:hypothetical protein